MEAAAPFQPLAASPIRNLWAALAIVVLTLAAYWPAMQAGFIWDDDQYVTNNALLRDFDGLQRIWIPKQTPQYYPVVFTTFWIEHQLWKLNPTGYHVVNVMLHALNALLVWRLCLVLRVPGGALAAWLIGAVFALHPVHVESVAWITERKNVLSGLFYLAAALAYLRFDGAREQRDAAKSGGVWLWYVAAFALFVMALLSKSVTCSLPAALILVMLWQRKPLSLMRLWPLAPMFIAGILLGINTAILEREHVLAIGPDFDFSLADRCLIASKALLFYPFKLLWPHPLIFVYDRWTINDEFIASYWSIAAVMLIGLIALIGYLKGWRAPALALAFFAGTIFPALGFLNVYPMIFSFVADHFQYLASLGIIVLVIGGLAHWLKDANRLAVIGLLILLMLGALTWHQSRAYRTIETLWRDTLDKNDGAWLAHSNLVPILVAQSQTARAAGEAATARRLVDQAIEHGRRAVEIKDNDGPSRSNYSQALMCAERFDEAIVQIQRAIELWPDHADYRWQLGYLHELNGNTFDAAAAYRKAVEMNEQSLLYRISLAKLLIQRAEFAQGFMHVQSLLRDISANPDRVGPNELNMLDALALACAKADRFEDAARIAEQMIAVARHVNRPRLVESFQPRLEAYRNRRLPAR